MMVGQKADPPLPVTADGEAVVLVTVKVEDRLGSGSGSGGSAVVDEDGLQLVDSGDSYFPADDDYRGCMGPVDGMQSEEDDGSDDNQSYFSDVLAAAEQQHHEAGEALSWWVWS